MSKISPPFCSHRKHIRPFTGARDTITGYPIAAELKVCLEDGNNCSLDVGGLRRTAVCRRQWCLLCAGVGKSYPHVHHDLLHYFGLSGSEFRTPKSRSTLRWPWLPSRFKARHCCVWSVREKGEEIVVRHPSNSNDYN